LSSPRGDMLQYIELLDGLTTEEKNFILALADEFDMLMLDLSENRGRARSNGFGPKSAIELSLAVVKMYGEELEKLVDGTRKR